MMLHSTFSDFIVFLYVHMSHADNSYDPQEMATIKSKMQKLFPAGTDLEKKLYATIRQYNSFDKEKLPELLTESLRHFTDKHETNEQVFSDLRDIIHADGKVLPAETRSLESLKIMIDQQVANSEA